MGVVGAGKVVEPEAMVLIGLEALQRPMRILVTGGAGYIGTHICLELMNRGMEPVVVDNFANSSPLAVGRVAEVAGQTIAWQAGDIRDSGFLNDIFDTYSFDAVIHLAGLKGVGDSKEQPLEYFDNNLGGGCTLLKAMRRAGVNQFVFSSSATVYGNATVIPVRESAPLSVVNPYGRTKLVMEQMIGDLCDSCGDFRAMSLRYFNPVGAHSSGRIGEDPRGTPGNLMPFIAQVAVGKRERLKIFGADYPTRDGTGVRDYLHVMDLARAHVSALDFLARCPGGCTTINIGRGRGVSVLELVDAFERVSGKSIPFEIVDRRLGDVAELWADPSLAKQLLGWRAELDVDQMCEDTWRWQQANPDGYRSAKEEQMNGRL